jgi:hypothetical protein
MTDLHKNYIADGEIFYLTSPDSIVFLSDNYSVLIKIWMYNAPNVKKVRIYWDNETDSLLVPVVFNNGVDSVDIHLPDLEERTYTFTVYMEDDFGNKSIPVTGSCSTVGNIWLNNMQSRSIEHVSAYQNENIIYWNVTPEYVYFTEVEYEDKNGATKIVQIPPAEMTTYLTDAKPCILMKHRSVYQIASGLIYGEWRRWDPHFNVLHIIGDLSGWNFAIAPTAYFDESNPYVYVFERVHLSGAIWKFNIDNRWDINISPPALRGNLIDSPIMYWQYYDPERNDFDPYWLVTTETEGDYKIVVDVNKMWITFEKL